MIWQKFSHPVDNSVKFNFHGIIFCLSIKKFAAERISCFSQNYGSYHSQVISEYFPGPENEKK